MIVTEEFISNHSNRINEVKDKLSEAKSYFNRLNKERLKKSLGVLYAPIIEDVLTEEAEKFLGSDDYSKDDMLLLTYYFNKKQLDDDGNLIENGDPYLIYELNNINFSF